MLLRLREVTGCSSPSIASPGSTDKTAVATDTDRFQFDVAASWQYYAPVYQLIGRGCSQWIWEVNPFLSSLTGSTKIHSQSGHNLDIPDILWSFWKACGRFYVQSHTYSYTLSVSDLVKVHLCWDFLATICLQLLFQPSDNLLCTTNQTSCLLHTAVSNVFCTLRCDAYILLTILCLNFTAACLVIYTADGWISAVFNEKLSVNTSV